MILTRTTELLREKPYNATLYTTDLPCTELGLNPGLNSEKPVTNHLTHGTVWIMEYGICLLVKPGLHKICIFCWPCILVQFVLITNLMHFFNVFHLCTCFKQHSAHYQDSQLYQYIIWYISLLVGGRLVCRSETSTPDGHLHKCGTNDMYGQDQYIRTPVIF